MITITDVYLHKIMCENKYSHNNNCLVAILMSMNWLAVYCTVKASENK